MKLNPKLKIELAVSKDPEREVINHVYLDAAKKRLVATNGAAIAIVPAEVDEGDISGCINTDAIKLSRKHDGKITASSDCKVGDSSFERFSKSKYPNYKSVFPSEDDISNVSISIDAKMLWDLAQAMGTVGVTIRLNKDTFSAMKVTPAEAGLIGCKRNLPADIKAFGYIMPVRPV